MSRQKLSKAVWQFWELSRSKWEEPALNCGPSFRTPNRPPAPGFVWQPLSSAGVAAGLRGEGGAAWQRFSKTHWVGQAGSGYSASEMEPSGQYTWNIFSELLTHGLQEWVIREQFCVTNTFRKFTKRSKRDERWNAVNKLFITNYSLSSIHHWDEIELLTGHGNKISFQRADIKILEC